MISSLIKRIQKTLNPSDVTGDKLDDLAFDNLSRQDPPPKAPTVEAPPLVLEPKLPAPAPRPKPPKPEAVIEIKPFDALLSAFTAEASKWLKVKEIGGPNKGPEVEMFQKAVDGKASGEPWCAAFSWYCILQTEAQFKLKYGKAVSSWLYKTEHVLTMWNLSPKESKLTAPIPGSLVIWQHMDAAGNQTSHGHVGIVMSVTDKTMMVTIEGNTSNDSVVQDEGDGVYMLKRNYKDKTGNKRIVGFLIPWKEF